MSKTIYQATCLRSLVRQLLPSAESKNFAESNFCTLSIHERRTVATDGTAQSQYVLFGETSHPTFTMGAMLVLTGAVPEMDGAAVRIPTRELDRALASFGTRTCQMELALDGGIRLTTVTDQLDEDAPEQPLKELLVRGESVAFSELPETLADGCAVMTDVHPLLDGLRSAVDIASTRGNGLKQQGVRLTVSPTCLCVTATNPSVKATTHYPDRWILPPAKTQSCVLTTDTVRHILSSFATFAGDSQLRLLMAERQLTVQCDGVTVICDVTE